MEPYKPRALGYCRCHSSPTDEETEGRTEAMGLAKAAPRAWWSAAPRMGSVGPRTERRSSSVPVPAEKIRR